MDLIAMVRNDLRYRQHLIHPIVQRTDLQILRTFVRAGEVVDVVELVLGAHQLQASQDFPAVDRTGIKVDFQHVVVLQVLLNKSRLDTSMREKMVERWELVAAETCCFIHGLGSKVVKL